MQAARAVTGGGIGFPGVALAASSRPSEPSGGAERIPHPRVIAAKAGIQGHQLELLSESRRPARKIMTAAAYGSRIGARVARLSGTTWVGWHGRDSAFSWHDLPELCIDAVPRSKRERGMPGARCTRGLVCKFVRRMRTRAYRFSGGNPAFPAQWFDGLCRAFPGDEFVLSPSLADEG